MPDEWVRSVDNFLDDGRCRYCQSKRIKRSTFEDDHTPSWVASSTFDEVRCLDCGVASALRRDDA